MGLIHPKLVGCKPNSDQWEWQPEQAESIEQVDDTHIRFKLKDALRWSGDFGDITAEDVNYSYERVIDPEINSPVAGDWGPLSHVEVEDRLTGVIVLKEPFQSLWTIALPYGVGHIVSKKAVEEAGGGTFGLQPPEAEGWFHTRCFRARDLCREQAPAMTKASGSSFTCNYPMGINRLE